MALSVAVVLALIWCDAMLMAHGQEHSSKLVVTCASDPFSMHACTFSAPLLS